MAYPDSIFSTTNPTVSNTLNSPSHAQQHIDANTEIIAIENELGITPKGAYATVKARLDAVETAIALKATLSSVFPVGCIYTTTIATNPATVFGFGTWTAFGSGRVLVGLSSGETEFNTVEETGGYKTHTLTEAEMPAHVHTQQARSGTQSAGSNGIRACEEGNNTTCGDTESTGDGGAHNNLQPYIVVYFWKRTV